MRPSALFFWIALGLAFLSAIIVMLPIAANNFIQGIWAFLGIAALADLLLSRSSRALNVELLFPTQIFVGDKANIPIKLDVAKGKLPARIDMVVETSTELEIEDHTVNLKKQELSATKYEAELKSHARGEYEIKQLWMCWTSSLRLFDIVSRRPISQKISAIPNIQPVLSGQITTKVQAELYGSKDTSYRGTGSEFHQLNDFSAGMDTRMIDWKRSARRGSLVARENRAEQNHQIILCVDNGRLMREKLDGLPKIDRVINAALATAWAAGLGGDMVGFFSFDSKPQVYLPPSPGRAAFGQIRAKTAVLKYGQVESNHTLAISSLNARLSRRSLIIVFSDFVDSTTAELLVENLGVLNKQHVLIYVSLRDPVVEKMINPTELTMDNIAISISATEINKERKIVLDQLRRLGIICLDVYPSQLTPELTSSYIDIKLGDTI